MPFASGSQAEVGYIEEVTYGVTPATPALVTLPVTGFTPEVGKDGFQSGDLRADRQIADFRHGAESPTFNIEIELKHGEFDPYFEAACFGVFSANVLDVGTTRKFFSMEGAYRDVTQFFQFTGCLVAGFNISVTTDATVSGSFSIVAQGATLAQTSLDADAYTPAGAKRSFDSFSGTIQEGGGAIAIVTAVELALDNAMEAARVVGNASPADYFDGRSNVTGTVTAYFEDNTLLDKFLNDTASSLEFTLTDPDGNTLTFLCPRIIYTGGNPPVSGEGPVTVSLPFQAVYDSVTGTNLRITRSA